MVAEVQTQRMKCDLFTEPVVNAFVLSSQRQDQSHIYMISTLRGIKYCIVIWMS